MTEQDTHELITKFKKEVAHCELMLKLVGSYEKTEENKRSLITPERIAGRLLHLSESTVSKLKIQLFLPKEAEEINEAKPESLNED